MPPGREWLVTNGIGGYASGMVDGLHTRSYHAFLTAALPAPIGRMVIWNQLFERVSTKEGNTALPLASPNGESLIHFQLEHGLPVWTFRVGDAEIERRIFLPFLQNTVVISYRLVSGADTATLELEPAFDFRKHGASVDETLAFQYSCTRTHEGVEILGSAKGMPPCRLLLRDGQHDFVTGDRIIDAVPYAEEAERGYPSVGQLWSPGLFRVQLQATETLTLIGSLEVRTIIDTILPREALAAEQRRRKEVLGQAGPAARDPIGTELVLAADQFIIRPVGRGEHRAHQRPEEITARTIIAGYHWFTDWGRDTMISFEGLTVTTGRLAEARQILLTFAGYVRDGLIPNLFPDGDEEGLYHTADATLWFFHAIGRYLKASDDLTTLRELLPTMVGIAEAHLRGTKFGIHVDPANGLLVQGAEGYQLTWMDAKMGDWVVTPRRGKAVEINALWYNALKLLADWLRQLGNEAEASRYENHARRAYESFNERFWFADGGYLYDLVEPSDSSCRPNQIFALSLDHPILAPERWAAVVETVQRELLTPFGLRSLSPVHQDYVPVYFGDLRARDGAYHQGTVWGWLIGPFIDAWLKVHPSEFQTARGFLSQMPAHLRSAGVGSISEVFDAEKPHHPRGCIAQAWSVAEVLRCWVKTAE